MTMVMPIITAMTMVMLIFTAMIVTVAIFNSLRTDLDGTANILIWAKSVFRLDNDHLGGVGLAICTSLCSKVT